MSVTVLYGCTDNSLYHDSTDKIRITGNSYRAAFTDSLPASSKDRSFSLEPGSQILLNAEGGLLKDKEVLTYSGNQWNAPNGLLLSDGENPTKITALYPVYAGLVYTEENLYSGDSLEDVLYVHDIFPAGENIHLQFKHLFSALAFHLSEELQNEFQQIDITYPAVVSKVLTESAEVILNISKSQTVSVTQNSSSGNYSLIIPPGENMSVTVAIQAGGKNYATVLPPKTFIGNEEYRYHLKISDKVPGIITAEDWIAFSKLINSTKLTEYNGKTLKDFGETADGVTTYYLLSNIDFQGVDCSQLEHVGGQNNTRNFEDIFDGKGHTISNLTPKSFYGTTGLFGVAGSNSKIKNIHLKACNVTLTPKNGSKSGTAMLAGINHGIISNCSLEESSINSTAQSTPTGGLVGHSYGTIINCFVQGTTLKSGSSSCGGITGYSQGNIINCFSANNSITSTKTNSGGISGRSADASSTNISNCYVYALKVRKTNGGLFYGEAENSIINHCFYSPTTGTTYASNLIGSSSNNQILNTVLFINNSTPIYELLNEWIVSEAPALYPEFTFTPWTTDNEELPAVFTRE